MSGYAKYAIARVRPFAETGEFANIGVVAADGVTNEIAFRLTPKRFRRVTQFFDIEQRLYSSLVRYLEDDLKGCQTRAKNGAERVLAELARPRETVVTFSELRTVRIRSDLQTLVDGLFEQYVKRSFATADYRETVMVSDIRHILSRARITGFKAQQIDDDLMPIRLPLVSVNRGVPHVIKPIAFDQKTTMAVLDHAAIWRDRFKHLLSRGKLYREGILIQLAQPSNDEDANFRDAYRYAVDDLKELDVALIDQEDVWALTEFARRGATSSGLSVFD